MARSQFGFDECADLICGQKYGAALQMFQRAVTNFLESKTTPRRNEIARQLFQIGTALEESLRRAYGDSWEAQVPRAKDEVQVAVCSFCGKSQKEVRKIIAGPSVYICDECVDLCDQILIKENLKENDQAAASSEERLCGICMEERESDELVFLPHAAYMCAGCLEAVQSVRDRSDQT